MAGKRVLVRVDFNVPLVEGKVAEGGDLRIRVALPLLELLQQKGAAKIVLLAHLGRPEGKVVEGLRMAPVEAHLRSLTSVPFELHENLRFDPREERNDPEFAKELAALGDVFVNEAFADSHRAHASICGVPKLLPSYMGLRFEEEVAHLESALTPPAGSIAIVGGSKFETKSPLIKKLLKLYAEVLLGGALANDVLKARGLPVGSSLVSATPVEPEVAEDARLQVPMDAVFGQEGADVERVGGVVDIRQNEQLIDIGPHTAEGWADKLMHAPFVLWNGPMGVYERGFVGGTDALAAALVQTSGRALVGGGDTAAAVQKYNFDTERIFVSTGGGAMLQFLTEGTLPGLDALRQ